MKPDLVCSDDSFISQQVTRVYRNFKILIIVSPAIKAQSVKSLAGLTLEGGDMLDPNLYPD